MAAGIAETTKKTPSIHGACVDGGGKGVIIVAPTGTGKTTQAFKLMELPEGRIVGDDWVNIDHAEGERLGYLVGKQPEKRRYMRPETQHNKPRLRKIFDEHQYKNVRRRKKNCELTQRQT